MRPKNDTSVLPQHILIIVWYIENIDAYFVSEMPKMAVLHKSDPKLLSLAKIDRF